MNKAETLPVVRLREETETPCNNPVITEAFKTFNEMIWQPVATMHSDWWQVLDLSLWQQRYRKNTVLGNRIEQLVVKRYGLVQQRLPCRFTDEQESLIAMTDKLEAIIVVLGLFCLNNPEYLLLKSYRDAIADRLTRLQIQQVWSIWPQRPVLSATLGQTIAVDDIVQQAFLFGVYYMDNYWQDDPVWKALSLCLPSTRLSADSQEDLPATEAFDLPRWISRLERLL